MTQYSHTPDKKYSHTPNTTASKVAQADDVFAVSKGALSSGIGANSEGVDIRSKDGNIPPPAVRHA